MSCLPNGLLNGTRYHYLARNTRTVPLTDDLFDNDSHCMPQTCTRQTLTIVEKDTDRAVRTTLRLSYVLIWSKPEKPYALSALSRGTACPARKTTLTWEDRPAPPPCTPAKPGPPRCGHTFER